MPPNVKRSVKEELQGGEPLTFDELKDRTGCLGQDLRRGLKELLHNDDGVYVHGVEDKQKLYAVRNRD